MSEAQAIIRSEFEVMKEVHDLIVPLSPEARGRVLRYIADVLGVTSAAVVPRPDLIDDFKTGDSPPKPQIDRPTEYSEFAELFDDCSPSTNAEKALVAAYWIQIVKSSDSFDGQSANTLVKHLGHAIPNITDALSQLISQKPALVLQLKKSGNSRQARKTYKVTTAGVKAIFQMIARSDG